MSTVYRRTLEGGHDALNEYCCTPCADDNLNAEAAFYCRNCSKLFCETCIQYHDKVLKDHHILGKEEVAGWGKVKVVTPVLMCEKHPDKEEEMYCTDHDLTCCHNCICIYHRDCKEVRSVTDVAKGLQHTPNFQSFLNNAAITRASLKNKLDQQTKNTNFLQIARDEIISSFKDIRKSFDQFMDNVEQQSTTEMDRLLSILCIKIKSDTDSCRHYENDIKKFLEDIETFGNQSNEFAFQCFKRCMRKISSAEKSLSSMEDVDYQLKFTPDASIQQFQTSLKTFGNFDITPINLPPEYVLTVEEIQLHNVKTKTDTKECSITGISQLPGAEGHVAIVDNANKKVKLLSSTQFSVISELDLPPFPNDICTTTKTELVVTVGSWSYKKVARNELHFINTAGGHLAHIKSKQIDHGCGAIACHNSQLYVGSGTTVYEYRLSGQKLRKIYEDASRPVITVDRFAVSDDGKKIYITNFDKNSLVTVDASGHRLSVLTCPELQKPTAICLADNGSMIVCGTTCHTVNLITIDGREVVTLAKESDGVSFPLSLCYDKKLKQLHLGQNDSDNLLVMKLK